MKKPLSVILSFLLIFSLSPPIISVEAEDSLEDSIFEEDPQRADGISLNGANQYGTANVNINPSENPNLTIEAWVNPKDLNSQYRRQQIVSHDDGGYDRSLLIESDWAGSYWTIFTGNDVWKPVKADNNKWQHVAVVYTPDNIYFYKNGVKYEYGQAPSMSYGKSFINIGKNPDFGEYFKGSISDLRIWSKTLESSQLNSSIVGPVGDLLGYWKLDENIGNIAKEYLRNEQNITFEGDPTWYYDSYIKQQPHWVEYGTSEGDIVSRTGDVDNLGFGFNDDSYDPLSSTNVYASNHSFPWSVDSSDPSGTDRIMVPSGTGYTDILPGSYQEGKLKDNYTTTTSPFETQIQDITLNFPLQAICKDENGDLKDKCIDAAELQLYVDDFQATSLGSKFTVTIDGKRFYKMEDVINSLNLTDQKGKLIKADIPISLLDELNDGELVVRIDDETTGVGDGFAIDFSKIVINPVKSELEKDYGILLNLKGKEQYGTANININSSEMPYLTMDAWVYPRFINNDWREEQQIISSDNGGYDRSLLITDSTDGEHWSVFTGNTSWSAAKVDIEKWQHIAVVYTPEHIYFYKNGKEYIFNGTPGYSQGEEFINIGKNPNFGEYFNGIISDIHIWNKALNDSEINNIFQGNQTFNDTTEGLVASWKLDETDNDITEAKNSITGSPILSIKNQAKWYANPYYLNSLKQKFIDFNTSQGEVVTRTGDIDNLGFGWNEADFSINSGTKYSTYHSYPWLENENDSMGTDRIMTPSSYQEKLPVNATEEEQLEYYASKKDQYVQSYPKEDSPIQPIWIDVPYNKLCSEDITTKCLENAELQFYIDDVQSLTNNSLFTVTLDGIRFPELEDIINHLDLSGPSSQLIKAAIPYEILEKLVNENKLEDKQIRILIDDKETKNGDGFAIDFTKLIINPKETYTKDIIFIPGIMGTELYELDGSGSKDILWKPEGDDVMEIHKLFLNDQGNPLNVEIKIGDPLDDYYGKIIRKLRMEGYRVHTFGYDWRLDNDYNVTQLKKFVNGKETDSGKQIKELNNFSIVAHSMGGLITARFIQDEENFDKVDKVITAGTPYLGAPKSLWTLETGEVSGEIKESFVMQDFKKLSSRSTSAYQLLPSFRYFNNSSSYYITLKKQKNNFIPEHLNDHNLTKTFLNTQTDFLYPNDFISTNPFFNFADKFHTDLNLSKIINSDKVYTLVGSDLNTLSNISYLYDENNTLLTKIPEGYLSGDGTVPLKSSTINGELLNNHNKFFPETSHAKLYNDNDVISKVKEILRSKNTPVIKNNSLTTELTSAEEWTSFTLTNISPEDVEITNREEIQKTGTIDIYPYGNDTIIHVSDKKLDFKLNNKQQIDMKIEHMNTKNKKVKTEKFKQTKIKKNNTFKFSKEKGITMQ